jgi:hypothetical protein
MQRHHLLDPNTHRVAIKTFAVRRQQRTSDLHNPTLGTCHLAPHDLSTLSQRYKFKILKRR